ncbi:MAG: DNA-directed RNA polymerase subunit beta' [Candidatus Staskawiczbacteria bacterium RIFCSPLOWO2_01_FULL_40_39]|uniref:DNA-directed RNA polymerase subunit beta' n=1 Tax=Candidatus Staskawiczbacteria bacterium RIFCSPHIGHO2_01_FULL_39_25 TaxID=1802202 RepID=A0A1G2HMQ4_9BACT|nr:MAG: DNA-directed RNA polymerase subunit beta' [Candidatus Staskawiczbacteria bacterium RIFCSPHIGHO2_01_FULL_39_25]OGZ73245.1 MAG: DNA-directed RNA polymerase subunit beta' [Candidatus Staskawiczbacteria bacterium RIFCSPLOWO2_01_FULL_40_39]OGZ76462.1 MAG: DNA-directed RNA polymerase subunit beta' [Candidatus Staskawiczbacteria bacterium RIFCSPLOWO2_02_FULL_39_8]
MRVLDLESIRIKIASPEEILQWSHGEIIRPETINYRTQKPEKDGLFDERIFGPEKDYECACGKYKRIRYKGIVCDRCGVEVTKSQVRRERMGHIKLSTPVSHIWFLRGVPSRMGLVLNKSSQQLEKVIYFSSYIITKVNDEARNTILDQVEQEYKTKAKKEKTDAKKQELKQLKEKVKEEILEIKELRILSEVVYHDLSLKYGEIFEAGTGAEVIKDLFNKIDLQKTTDELVKESKEAPPITKKKILRRLKLFQGMLRAKVRPEWMFIDVLPVLPPDLRPMVQLDGGRYASSDLNDLYRRVINRNNRLKYLQEISAPPVIVRNEKRMLQEAVDALIDNEMRKGVTTTATTGGKRLLKSLAAMLAGKQGRFRQNLLGKRVDYSGRSVIAVGPELSFSQCGLPKTLALEIFKPFVIKRILDKELAYNIRGAARLIEEKVSEVWAILEEIVKDKVVLLNRAPTLHRLGIQAFHPVLTEGETIKLHPLACEAFNADFDGDQMAVYLPLSEEAQKEAREIMLSSLNLLRPATGLPVIGPFRDIALGCYFLTKMKEPKEGQEVKIYSSMEEAITAHEYGFLDLTQKIKVPNPKSDAHEIIETCVGRLIVNATLPKTYPYVSKLIDNKVLKALVRDIIEKYPGQESITTLDKIKVMGFEYCTLSGISWGMDDLIVPKEKKQMIFDAEREIEKIDTHYEKGLLSHDEKTSQKIMIWQGVKARLEVLLKTTLPEDGPVISIITAGARATWSQPIQMAGMKGLVNNPAGDIIELPVKSSFAEGFNVLEYFISTHGARKGTADTALRTSSAGYLTRRLIDVAHDVITSEEDCGDKKGMTVFKKEADDIEQDFTFKLVGRTCMEDVVKNKETIVKKGEIINWHQAGQIVKEGIEKAVIRSPLNCKSTRGVCQKCYGWDLSRNQLVKLGEAVGVVAAQAIGEPGTQLTLRTHHLGGVVGAGDITQGLPRIEEIFEARNPKGEAVMSLAEGKVIKIDEEKRVVTIKPAGKKGNKELPPIEYKIPGKIAILVAVGDEVKENQPLCGGNLDLKKLYKSAGMEATQKYILKEVQRIYASQGVDINDKHVEVIIQKMFSRIRVKEEGDATWVRGEVVEWSIFQEEVERLKKLKKEPPLGSQILLGISEVALASESFLSAASFQQTSRVLIKAALEGKEDKLRGLKENVIIGKLIPVGTGFRKK